MEKFEGFEPANTTPVPDILFDELLTELTGAELKVLLYIIRRTRGFKKDTDAISLSQLQNGIITKDGKVLDKGSGIKRRDTIVDALASLEKQGCITVQKGNDPQGDKATTVYGIKFKKVVTKPDYPSNITGLPVVTKPDYPSPVLKPPVVTKPDQQETVIHSNSSQETEQQENHNTRKRSTLKSKLATLEDFNFDQSSTAENIMQLGDCWRGGPLPESKRADSDYQKALLQGATPLMQRRRPDGKSGYTLREIDTTYRFLKRIAPEGKDWLVADEWWIGKNVDLWVVGKNIDKALADIAKLEKSEGKPALQVVASNSSKYVEPNTYKPQKVADVIKSRDEERARRRAAMNGANAS